jgi:hypothetical protein
MCKMEHKAHSERHAVSPAKLFVTKVEAHVSNILVLLHLRTNDTEQSP